MTVKQRPSCRHAKRKVVERHEVERIVMEHGVHITLKAGANVFGVDPRNSMARYVIVGAPAADMPFERLQPAVGQMLPPAAAGVVKDVDVSKSLVSGLRLQAMSDASFKDHRPIERFPVESDEHVVFGKRLPK